MKHLLLFLALALSSCTAFADTDSVEPNSDAQPDWLELASQDVQSRALLEKALGKLGLHSFDELVNYVTVCDDTKIPATRRGQTEQKWQTITENATESDLRSGKAPADYFRDRIEADRIKFNGLAIRMVEVHPDYVRARFWVEPSICLREGMSMIEQYETFIHELTHLVETDQLAEDDLLAYADLDDYALKTVLSPGSEVDAFIAGTSAQLRLVHSLTDIPVPFRIFFDEDGKFTGDRTAFAKVILAPRPAGMGYRDNTYRKQYQLRLEKTRELEIKTRERVVKLAGLRLKSGNRPAYERLQADLASRDERLRKFDALLDPSVKP